MFKTIALTTIIATAATLATAETEIKYDLSLLPADVAARVMQLQQYGDRFDATIVAIIAEHSKPISGVAPMEYDLSLLPTEVAEHVTLLMEHGDRFEPAIRAIFAEHIRPEFGFGTEFGTDEENTTEAPQS